MEKIAVRVVGELPKDSFAHFALVAQRGNTYFIREAYEVGHWIEAAYGDFARFFGSRDEVKAPYETLRVLDGSMWELDKRDVMALSQSVTFTHYDRVTASVCHKSQVVKDGHARKACAQVIEKALSLSDRVFLAFLA
ncbi:hypothetical protein [Sinimarinibacterium sp. NLF-5-8]|uniref:hypothetical protein n=1 Tax=Sinimarinibacterium sp. NLF-5-8 TaxID=2698684 RepID=UPI00137BB4F0|nr:hypothetical protein [Sinimarinibacterium sp. NLF-5-8]QHS09151.1 hypothetical protein GT972_02590 [Sinimarinibacterium sp. NLF-5-8]